MALECDKVNKAMDSSIIPPRSTCSLKLMKVNLIGQGYERLLDRTKHLKVWISYAEFEASAGLGVEDSESEENKNEVGYQEQQMERVRKCRAVFERAFNYFRTSAPELKEERAMLLEEWLNKEVSFGDLGHISLVQKKAPRKVKRKRPSPTEDGSTVAYEEYIDYIFPDDED